MRWYIAVAATVMLLSLALIYWLAVTPSAAPARPGSSGPPSRESSPADTTGVGARSDLNTSTAGGERLQVEKPGRLLHTIEVRGQTLSGEMAQVEATASCESCGMWVGGAAEDSGLVLAHEAGVTGEHRVRVSAPGYHEGLIIVRPTGAEAKSTVILKRIGSALTVLHDMGTAFKGAMIQLRDYAPGVGLDDALFRTHPAISVRVDDSKLSTEFVQGRARMQVPLNGPTWISVDTHPTVLVLARPGHETMLDLRKASVALRLRFEDDTPASGIGVRLKPLDRRGGGSIRTTKSDGTVLLPPQDGGLVSIKLFESDPVVFADEQPARDVLTAEGTHAVLALGGNTLLTLRRTGWVFTIVERESGQPVRADVRTWVEVEVRPSHWELARSARGRSDQNGLVRTATSLPPLDQSIRQRLVVRAAGWAPALVDLDRESRKALTGEPGGGPRIGLDRALGPCYLRITVDGQPLDGVRCSIVEQGLIRAGPCDFLTDANGEGGPFWIGTEGAGLMLAGQDEPLVSLRASQGVLTQRGYEFELKLPDSRLGRIRVHNSPDDCPTLFASDAHGAVYEFNREGPMLTAAVPPGLYVVGPLEWVRNEAHRLQDQRLTQAIRVEVGELSMSWQSNWSWSEEERGTVHLSGADYRAVSLIPVYGDLKTVFLPQEAGFMLSLNSRGQYHLPPGRPKPNYLLVCVEVSYLADPVPAVLKVLRPGDSTRLDLGTLEIRLSSDQDWWNSPPLSLRVQHEGAFPGIDYERRLRRILPIPPDGCRVGPLPLHALSVLSGQRGHSVELFPNSTSSSRYEISVVN